MRTCHFKRSTDPVTTAGAKFQKLRVQFYSERRLKTPYNFPLVWLLFPVPPKSKIACIIFIVALNSPQQQQLKHHMLTI